MAEKFYRVQLPCLVPHYYTCWLDAGNPLDAFQRGLEVYASSSDAEDEEAEDLWRNIKRPVTLDLGSHAGPEKIPDGAIVEECDEQTGQVIS